MISAWEVYLFMQAEGIALFMFLLSAATFTASVLSYLSIDIIPQCGDSKDFGQPKKLALIAAALFAVTALIPSRATIAAMYIVPKLTSNEVVEPVTKEAKELYSLFKDALINLAEKGKD